jgi:hypothetical protein
MKTVLISPIRALLVARALLTLLCLRPATATEVVPLTLTETARQAHTIVLGTVVSQKSRWGTEARRWMVTDYTFAVEEMIYPPAQGETGGKTITVTYWGGTLDGEGQGISDVRLPAVGERLLLMLAEGWDKQVSFSPVVGLNQGLFTIGEGAAGPAIVRDGNGVHLLRRADGEVVKPMNRSDAEASAPQVELGVFVSWLRANLTKIKAAPSELPPHADRNDPRVLRVFAKTPTASREKAPADGGRVPAVETTAAPAAPAPLEPADFRRASDGGSTATLESRLTFPDYSYPRTANIPIVLNNFPDAWTPWSPEDEFQLSKWNYYATNVFRVFTTPTGNWAWQNDRFDLCGWPSSADMQAQFGAPWAAGTIGICYTRWNTSTNVILEGDIALNPAFSFTLDDEWVNDGSTARSFRQVMMHELGHMWGLAHQFNFPSIMNDSQDVHRFFGFPYMDDAEAIRAAFPAATVPRTDLAVYLRYSTGTQSITDATFPSSVGNGLNFTVNNYHLENVGTAAVTTPTIEWYLTTARNYTSPYHYLGATTYGSLTRFNFFTPSSTSRTLTVPTSVPPGFYYLNAFIRNDAGPSQGSYPFDNNQAFSRTRMQVTQTTYSVNPSAGTNGTISPSSAQTVNIGASAAFTATPSAGYIVDQWTVNGTFVRTGGRNYTVTNVTGNRTVNVTFKRALTSVVSRKTHGSAGDFNIDLPIGGAPAVEPRQSGGNHTLVFTFANPVTTLGSASVGGGSGSVSGTTFGTDTRQVFVNLTGVANAQTTTVTLGNVSDSFGNTSTVSASIGFLVGDATVNGSVTATDIGQVKSQSGQPVTASNFRSDLNASGGSINTSDIGLVKSAAGTQLP